MTNYNDGKWHGWNGGECPVHPETVVDFMADNGNMSSMWREMAAKQIAWTTHKGCFRVIKEHKEPREFWCVLKNMHSTKEEAEKFLAALERDNPGLDFGKVFHVKEQQE